MDLIFLSSDKDNVCENTFALYQGAFKDIKRVHGLFNHERAISICAAISNSRYFAVIDGNISEVDPKLLEGLDKSIDGANFNLPDIVSIFDSLSVNSLDKKYIDDERSSDDYDIIYLTYDEKIANDNFVKIKQKYPNAMRLHKVSDMTRAFAMTAHLASTKRYILIDGDNIVLDDAALNTLSSIVESHPETTDKSVMVFGARNGVNDLEYCYGGIKVCPTLHFRRIIHDSVDPIASQNTKVIFYPKKILSITNFNSDSYGAWKAGFREAVMLSTSCFLDFEGSEHWGWANKYLDIWKTRGQGRSYGEYCMDGANDGHRFAQEQAASIENDINADDFRRALTEKLSAINEPGWLKERFQSQYVPPQALVHEKFNSAADVDSYPIRLCAVIGDNCDMLPHFIDHYRDLGVDEFHIILHAPPDKEDFRAEALRIMQTKGIIPAQIYEGGWNSRISTNLINSLKTQYPDDWFVVADSDELQIYEKPLRDIINGIRDCGQTYITGSFVDRISEDGAMKAIDDQSSIWEQFPYAGFVSFPLSGAMPYKITACRGDVILSQGQHGVLIPESKWPVTGKVEAQVHHFKWNKNVYDNLVSRQSRFKDAYDSLNDGDRAYYLECASVLRYLDENRGINLNDKIFILSKGGNKFSDYPHWDKVLKRTESWTALQESPRVVLTNEKVGSVPSP